MRHFTIWVVCGALIGSSFAAAAQDSPKDEKITLRGSTDGEAMVELTRILAEEAKEFQRTGQLKRGEANVASVVDRRIDTRAISKFLVRQADKDTVIDAYVRWQLTSFDPGMPAMDLHRFQAFLERLPGLGPNPRADEDFIAALQQARKANPLSADDARRIGESLDAMTSKASRATDLNQPALKLRQWLIEKTEDRPADRLMAMLERIDEMLTGGWDIRDLKQQFEIELVDASADQGFSRADRQAVAEVIARLAGRRRLVLESARIADDALAASFVESAVYDFDATRWKKLLLDD